MMCFHHQQQLFNFSTRKNFSVDKDCFGPLKSQPFILFINRLGMVPAFAHHPSCKYYHNHIIWLGKLPVCLGCSMMGCGIGVGLLLIPHLGVLTALPFSVLLCLGVLLYLPAIFQIWIQKKAYKIIARFSLGISVVLLFYAGICLTSWSWFGWILKAGFLMVFYVVWKLTLKVRSEYSKSPCDNCPEGRYPICSYTISRIPQLANNYFAEADGTDPEADDFVTALKSVYSTAEAETN